MINIHSICETIMSDSKNELFTVPELLRVNDINFLKDTIDMTKETFGTRTNFIRRRVSNPKYEKTCQNLEDAIQGILQLNGYLKTGSQTPPEMIGKQLQGYQTQIISSLTTLASGTSDSKKSKALLGVLFKTSNAISFANSQVRREVLVNKMIKIKSNTKGMNGYDGAHFKNKIRSNRTVNLSQIPDLSAMKSDLESMRDMLKGDQKTPVNGALMFVEELETTLGKLNKGGLAIEKTEAATLMINQLPQMFENMISSIDNNKVIASMAEKLPQHFATAQETNLQIQEAILHEEIGALHDYSEKLNPLVQDAIIEPVAAKTIKTSIPKPAIPVRPTAPVQAEPPIPAQQKSTNKAKKNSKPPKSISTNKLQIKVSNLKQKVSGLNIFIDIKERRIKEIKKHANLYKISGGLNKSRKNNERAA